MAACCCRSMLYPRVNDTLFVALCFGLYHSASRALRHSPPLVLSKTAVVAVVEGHCLGARSQGTSGVSLNHWCLVRFCRWNGTTATKHVLALHVTLTRIGLCARESTHHLTTCWPGHHGRRRHSSATMCYSTARSATGRTLASRPSPAPALPPPPLPPLGDAISRKVYAPRPRHQGMCATDTRRPWRTDQQEVRPPAGQRATARGLQEAQKLVSIPARWSRAAELRKEWMRPADGASAAAMSHACSARSRRPSPRRTRAGGGG